MAVTAYAFSKFAQYLANKQIDFDTDTIKVALFTNSYTPNQDTDDLYSNLSNEHAATGNYSTGGETLSNASLTQTLNVIKLDGDNITWSSSTITARYAVIYDSTNSCLIAYVDFGEDKSSSGSDFTITWNESGIVTLTAGDA
jgi:hypothetical protein